MGHTRLGTLPKSVKWRKVVAAVTGTAEGENRSRFDGVLLPEEVAHIAQQTIEAAKRGLIAADDDIGLRYTFYLLTQLVLAARQDNWQERMEAHGLNLPHDATPMDLTAEVQGAIDEYLTERGATSDWSEMAQQAAGEALLILTASKANTLFGVNLQPAVRPLSTTAGFSDLGQQFFARFMYRFLNFYLCRVTAGYTGGEKLVGMGELNRFNATLEQHCVESAKIVHDFCGSWYSKTNFEQGIDMENTSRFIHVALTKLRRELTKQGAEE